MTGDKCIAGDAYFVDATSLAHFEVCAIPSGLVLSGFISS